MASQSNVRYSRYAGLGLSEVQRLIREEIGSRNPKIALVGSSHMRNISAYLKQSFPPNVTYTNYYEGGRKAKDVLNWIKSNCFPENQQNEWPNLCLCWCGGNDIERDWENQNLNFAGRLLQQIADVCRDYNCTPIIISIPIKRWNARGIQPREYSKRANQSNKLLFRELLGSFFNLPSYTLGWDSYNEFYASGKLDGCHFTKRIYRQIADFVVETMAVGFDSSTAGPSGVQQPSARSAVRAAAASAVHPGPSADAAMPVDYIPTLLPSVTWDQAIDHLLKYYREHPDWIACAGNDW